MIKRELNSNGRPFLQSGAIGKVISSENSSVIRIPLGRSGSINWFDVAKRVFPKERKSLEKLQSDTTTSHKAKELMQKINNDYFIFDDGITVEKEKTNVAKYHSNDINKKKVTTNKLKKKLEYIENNVNRSISFLDGIEKSLQSISLNNFNDKSISDYVKDGEVAFSSRSQLDFVYSVLGINVAYFMKKSELHKIGISNGELVVKCINTDLKIVGDFKVCIENNILTRVMKVNEWKR